jgi:2-phospho-L-lactate transferase/gluconeogenesis factor (CofD/UPF0052 family)
LAKSQALKIYVCNAAEEPAQTVGYSVQDHLDVVVKYGGGSVVDAVIANNNVPEGPTPAGLDFIQIDKPWTSDVILVAADVIDETDLSRSARHDPVKLSNTIAEAYRKYRGRRRRLPRVRLNLDLGRPSNGRKIDS